MGLLRRSATKKEFRLSELRLNLDGVMWADTISLDKRLVENNECPAKKCRSFLVYHGYSNAAEYRAYGVCEACDYARLFWAETVDTAAAKRSLVKQAA